MKVKKVIVIFFTLVTLTPAVRAGSLGSNGVNFAKTQKMAFALDDVDDWLADVRQKIMQQPNFPNLCHALENNLSDDQGVTCAGQVQPSGTITNLRIFNSCGSCKLDQMVLTEIQNSAPFDKVPNNIPSVGNVLFHFRYLGRKSKGCVKLIAEIDHATQASKFPIHQYLKPDAKHPWRAHFDGTQME